MGRAWSILAAVVGLFLLWKTLQVDFVLFAGILLAIFLHHVALLVERLTGLGQPWALLATVLGLLCLTFGIGYFFASTMLDQLHQLPDKVSGALDNITNADLKNMLNSTALQKLFGVAFGAAYLVGALVVIAFIGFYLAFDQKVYERGVINLLPAARREKAWKILSAIGETLWYWSVGRLVSMTVVGVVVTVGLWCLGLTLPLALGALAGVLTFIPYIGAVMAAVPTLLIAFASSQELGIYVLLLYVGVHIVEGYMLVPLIQKRAVRMPPALTLASQVLFGAIAGLVGVTFATPVVAAVITVFRMTGARGAAPLPPPRSPPVPSR